MYQIATLNKISPVGLANFSGNYTITDDVNAADGILVRSQDMLEMTFSSSLKSIARAGAGVNNIPLDRCAEEGIVVFNTPGANANAVKELVILGLLLAARNVPAALGWAKALTPNDDMDVAKQVEKGKSKFAGHEIAGKTLGVIGLGAIGRKVAYAAQALGMNVVGYDPFVESLEGITVFKEFKDILPLCDYVTLHLPANDKTKKMVNAEFLGFMKDGAILLNFSRDKLTNFADLFAALESGKVSQYVTDFPTDDVVGKDKVILLPHLGASTEEAEDNCACMAVSETVDFLENGNIINSVNFRKVDLGKKEGARVSAILKGVEDAEGFVKAALEKAGLTASKLASDTRKDGISYVLAELASGNADAFKLEGAEVIKVRTF